MTIVIAILITIIIFSILSYIFVALDIVDILKKIYGNAILIAIVILITLLVTKTVYHL